MKKNNRGKSNCHKPKLPNKNNRTGSHRKITDEREPIVFFGRARGLSYQAIADEFGKQFKVKIDQSTIYDYLQKRKDQYQLWLQTNIKEDVRLANAKARILDLEHMANKLGEAILDIIKEVPKSQWDDIALPALVKQYRELLAQIQDESGDKVHKFKADGITGDFIFGDKTINVFADKTVQARVKETADPGNRFKKAGFSDFGDSLSDN